jgi:predicted alpha/beta-fold hydrolase
MPLISESDYVPPKFLSNGHLQSILPTLFRQVKGVDFKRERIETPDKDFLDLDWSRVGADRLVIITHGLEGSSRSPYILGMVQALNDSGWDAVAWNFRGCSGETNRTNRLTHSGASDDFETVVKHILTKEKYSCIGIVAFSLGGNLVLKYLGEQGKSLDDRIKKAVAFSVPCDLKAGAIQLAQRQNKIYMRHFLRSLQEKLRIKKQFIPEMLDHEPIGKMKTFQEFDEYYTAPIHGFLNADDYWARCSSKSFIKRISIPTLLVNAKNDPFLAKECYPIEEAKENPNFFLEMPESGGHAGFIGSDKEQGYWSESRAIAFLEGN